MTRQKNASLNRCRERTESKAACRDDAVREEGRKAGRIGRAVYSHMRIHMVESKKTNFPLHVYILAALLCTIRVGIPCKCSRFCSWYTVYKSILAQQLFPASSMYPLPLYCVYSALFLLLVRTCLAT